MLKEFEIAGYDMPCVDLAVNVDVFPKPNGGTGINAMSWQGGGKVATGMVAAARLGAKCAMIGAVGSDDYGEFCLRDFERHGIDISGMKTRQGETTSLSIVLSDRETQGRSIVYRSGTANPPALEEIEERILTGCQWFFISHATHVAMESAKRAKKAGAKIIVDADSYSSEMMENIGIIDVFIASEFFYKVLFRGKEEAFEANCREVQKMGPSIVVFTLGAKGCVGTARRMAFFRCPPLQWMCRIQWGRRCVPRAIYRRIAARAFFQRSRSACHGSFLHQVYQNWRQSRHSRLEYGAALFAHRGNRLYGN